MKRSRISRGLQLMYWNLIISILIVALLVMVSDTLWEVNREAAQAVMLVSVRLPLLAALVLPLVGLLLLWREHRNYRLVLLLTALAWAINHLDGGWSRQPWLRAALSVAVLLLWTGRDALFLSTTNQFLRRAGAAGAAVLGRWVLITAIAQRLWSAALNLLPPAQLMWSGDELSQRAPLAVLLLGAAAGVLELIYLVWASRALRFWHGAQAAEEMNEEGDLQ